MEVTTGEKSNSMSDSNKSTGGLSVGTSSCAATHISSGNYSDATTSIAYKYDESIEIKAEIIEYQERHQGGDYNLLSKNNQLDKKSPSSSNKYAPKTTKVYENDETLEIKEEILQEQSNSMSNKSTGILAAGTVSCATTQISSSNYFDAKTSIVYEYDASVEIKEEIIEDQETVLRQKIHKKYVSTLNTVDTREADILSANQQWTHKEKMIRETKTELEKKYKCQKCARTYKYKHTLNTHKKFECNVTPQFICKFCDKRFKYRSSLGRHVGQTHQKINLNQNKKKIEESKQEPEKNHNSYRHQKTNLNISQASYNCDKCFRTYSSLSNLNYHNRSKHASAKPEFTCDICGYKMNTKSNLSRHVSSRHFKNAKTSESRHNCNKCFLSYSSLEALRRHNRLKHASVKPEFICEVCGHKSNRKSTLSAHIFSRHFKNSKTPKARHTCDKCYLNYSSLGALRRHNSSKHAAFKQEFTCDVCSYKTSMKSTLKKHISSRHFKDSSQARRNCDKCSRSYGSLAALKLHERLKHAAVKP